MRCRLSIFLLFLIGLVPACKLRDIIPAPRLGTTAGSTVQSCEQTPNSDQCISSDRCGFCISSARCLPLAQASSCTSGWVPRDPDQTQFYEGKADISPIQVAYQHTRHAQARPTAQYNVKGALSTETYDRLRELLVKTSSGLSEASLRTSTVDDSLVDAFVIALWREYQPAREAEYARIGLPPPPADFKPTSTADSAAQPANRDNRRYYAVQSRHTRFKVADFDVALPMVRVSLPVDEQDYSISTNIGDVLSSDHLLRNVKAVAAKGYPCERVELYTPARRDGNRFAAVALYLAYTKFADRLPAYYIVEAGLAQGGPRMIYIAPNLQSMVRRAGYTPTPFSKPEHYYTATLTMSGDDPASLQIDVFESDPRKNPKDEGYATINARFERAGPSDPRLQKPPVQLFRESAVRVAAIANAMGIKLADFSILQGLFASDGLTLDWLTKPATGPAAAPK